MSYDIKEHVHNFAVWTAARAAQRGFTTTANIASAIDQTELRGLSDHTRIWTPENFDQFHEKTANRIIKDLDHISGKETTYGRAAKIIAIYIKTAVILPSGGTGKISEVAHPPIDNILLTNLKGSEENPDLPEYKWTLLDQKKYFEIINKLRTLSYENFWEVERYWKAVQVKNLGTDSVS